MKRNQYIRELLQLLSDTHMAPHVNKAVIVVLVKSLLRKPTRSLYLRVKKFLKEMRKQRNFWKCANHGMLYGMDAEGLKKLSQRHEPISEDRAEGMISNFYKLYGTRTGRAPMVQVDFAEIEKKILTMLGVPKELFEPVRVR